MKVRRGDVVLIPFSDASGAKVRPAVVVQSDARNSMIDNTIVALITKNISRIQFDPSQLMIDIISPAGKQSGLRTNSAVTCGNLFTVHEARIMKKIGELPQSVMQSINMCLKSALGL